MSVDVELKTELNEDISAANSPATTNPLRPAGNTVFTISGKAASYPEVPKERSSGFFSAKAKATTPGIMKMNRTLAGQIEREYQLEKSKQHIVPYLEEMGREYQKNWDYYQGQNLKVDSLWVNLQQKTEYNPIHNHDKDLSFVLFLNSPEEIKLSKFFLSYLK